MPHHRDHGWLWAGLAMHLAIVGPAVTNAQEIQLQAATDCTACRVELQRVTTLQAPDDAPAWVAPRLVERDSRGTWYVADPFGAKAVYAYDRSGRSVATLGRAGSGPGEFSLISTLLVAPGDSLHVFGTHDNVYGPRRTLARTVRIGELPRIGAALPVPDGRLVVHAYDGRPDRVGQPFHMVTLDGRVERSFGLDSTANAPRNAWSSLRSLAVSTAGRFWASHRNRYRIELWSTAGQLVSRFERKADWFEPWQQWNSRVDIAAPPPRLISIWQDSLGLVWTLVRVADANWKPKPGARADQPGEFPTAKEYAQFDDSVIEVIDPRTAKVLHSKRFPNAFDAIARDGTLVEIVEDDEVRVNLWRMRFVRS